MVRHGYNSNRARQLVTRLVIESINNPNGNVRTPVLLGSLEFINGNYFLDLLREVRPEIQRVWQELVNSPYYHDMDSTWNIAVLIQDNVLQFILTLNISNLDYNFPVILTEQDALELVDYGLKQGGVNLIWIQ